MKCDPSLPPYWLFPAGVAGKFIRCDLNPKDCQYNLNCRVVQAGAVPDRVKIEMTRAVNSIARHAKKG